MSKEIAERLRYYMEESGLSARRLSLSAGLADTAVRDILNQKSHNPKFDTLSKLADVLNIPVRLLTEGRKTVPIVGYIGAGAIVYSMDDHANGAGLEEVDAPPGCGEGAVAVIVRGDSQYPAYRDGDILIYDTHLPPGEAVGRECVTRLTDGRTMLKIVMRGAQGLFDLHSYNAPPITGVALDWCAPIAWIKRP